MCKTVMIGGGIALGFIALAMHNAPKNYGDYLNACLDAGLQVKHCQGHAINMMQNYGNDALFLKGKPEEQPQQPAAFLPDCKTEDSDNCYWDALERGNGQGTSFVSYKGKWYYMDPAPICTTDAVCEMMYPPAP